MKNTALYFRVYFSISNFVHVIFLMHTYVNSHGFTKMALGTGGNANPGKHMPTRRQPRSLFPDIPGLRSGSVVICCTSKQNIKTNDQTGGIGLIYKFQFSH